LAEIKKIVVLFSGAGKNLESIIKKLHKKQLRDNAKCLGYEVVAAITNKPEAKGIDIATEHHVSTVVLDHKLFDTRESFDTKLVSVIESYEPDIVVLAGFMRILTPVFTSNITAINLHPSLLPKFKGAKAIERSFESDDIECGVSVHYVSDELDGGDIILQDRFDKDEGETLESFSEKIKTIEHRLLPQAIEKVLCG
jgi:phosphoribosylglycinamide formyltransferase 1